MVPWLGHALLILTTEWAGQRERDTQGDDDSEDEGDSEDEIEGIDLEGGETNAILLSELLNGREFEDLEGEEEEDVKNDPIHDIDICEYISNSMRSVSNTQIAKVFLGAFFHIFHICYLGDSGRVGCDKRGDLA